MANVVSALPDYPFFVQAGDAESPLFYDAEDFRRFLGGFYQRDGVVGGPLALYVTQAASVGWSIRVDAGYAVLNRRYLFHNQAALTISVLGLNTNPSSTRTHKVYACIYDKLTSGSEYAQKIVVAEDTGTGAVPPADATHSQLLATFTIANGQPNIQNAQIDNQRTHAAQAATPSPLTAFETGYVDAAGSTLTDGFSASVSDNVCRLYGSVRRSSGDFTGGVMVHIATLPPAFRPAGIRFLTAGSSFTPYTAQLKISTVGSMFIKPPGGADAAVIYFDGITYNLD